MIRIKYTALLLGLLFSAQLTQAQLFKGFGEKVQKKVENRIERKAERAVDKTLDKGENATDKAAKDAVTGDKKKNNKKLEKGELSESLNLPTVESRPEQIMVLSDRDDCGSFIWFTKGSTFTYETSSGGMKAVSDYQVVDLENTKGKLVAHLKASTVLDGQNYDMEMQYVCEGNKIYLDVAEMMKSLIQNNPDLKKHIEPSEVKTKLDLKNGYAVFPKQLFPGLELDDVNFSFANEIAGAGKMEITVNQVDRIVEAKEMVNTSAGDFECMKIRSVIQTSVSVMGINRVMPPQVDYLWISPKVGLVKQESHEKNKVVSHMSLTKYAM